MMWIAICVIVYMVIKAGEKQIANDKRKEE